MKLNNDKRRETGYLSDNIVRQIENAFQLIHKDITWQSFYRHRLPDIINTDQKVQEVAI